MSGLAAMEEGGVGVLCVDDFAIRPALPGALGAAILLLGAWHLLHVRSTLGG